MIASESHPVPAAPRRSIYPLLTVIVVAACLIIPIMFWSGAWFGRRLDDEQLAAYLAATDEPRKIQHALTEITERISKGDGPTHAFYPAVVPLVNHKSWQVRNTAAWVMGWDKQGNGFRESLRQLLDDPVLVVRHNAALALTNFDDHSGRAVILSMLEPTPVSSTRSGVVSDLLPVEAPVRVDLDIATITLADKQVVKLKAPISGRIGRRFVTNDDAIGAGDLVYEIQPGEIQLAQAIQALGAIGDPRDAATIRSVCNRPTITSRLVTVCTDALEAVKTRNEGPSTHTESLRDTP